MILQAFVRGAIIIAVAALLATLLRHRSAALRHHVWATALVVQLALLAFIPLLPPLNLPVVPTIRAELDQPMSSTVANDAAGATNVERTVPTPSASAENLSRSSGPQGSPARRSIGDYVLFLWMLGAGVILARYLIGTWLMMRVAVKGERIEDGDWLALAQRTARELGITRPVTMIWGDRVAVPITWGVLYPMILLPKGAHDWPQERRRFVLVHEMAHVKRFDAFTQFLAQLTTALFWFSPFVWLAEWRMRIEREHACDDTVIRHGTEPSLYADELLQMVRTLVRRRTPQPAFAALAMARKSEFEGRMLAILDPERPRRVTGITSGLGFALLSVLIAAPLAAVDPFAVRVVTASTKSAEPQSPAPAPLAVKPLSSEAGCDFTSTADATSVNTHENAFDVRLKRGARCVLADVSGGVRISPDERRILGVDNGGLVRLREATSARVTELLIERTTGTGVRRAFTVNGRVPDDDGRAEREWVARILPELLSEGAIHTQERVLRLLQTNGLSGTLQQIASLRSPAGRLSHFKELVAIGNWSAAEIRRINAAATESLKGSPNDLAAFNRALPKARAAKPRAVAMNLRDVELMEEILEGISSSYDVQLAMKSQVPTANAEMLLMFARVAAKMANSHEVAEFLKPSIPYYLARDQALTNAWFQAARQIGSSSERKEVLLAALDYVQGNEQFTLLLLDATTNMSSTVDKTAVLVEVAKRKLIRTPALRSAFLAQVKTIASGVDRRAIIEAL
jgi:beta-lactamase regulating signal transducer with metallopeptidase domain